MQIMRVGWIHHSYFALRLLAGCIEMGRPDHQPDHAGIPAAKMETATPQALNAAAPS
jgi:hypothetical protein